AGCALAGHAAQPMRGTGTHCSSAWCVAADRQAGTLAAVDADSLARTAALLPERNAIDAELAELTERPMTSGHLGEWIAAQVFDIALEEAANAPAINARFRSGPLGARPSTSSGTSSRKGCSI